MKKFWAVVVIVSVIFGVWFFVKEPAQAPETDTMEQPIAEHAPEGTTNADEPRQSTVEDMMPPVEESPKQAGPTPSVKTFTAAEVALHNNKTSCYSIIRDQVYDLTPFFGQHPGGDDAILKLCGKDGTEAFVEQHGGRPKQEGTLDSFKVGDLAK